MSTQFRPKIVRTEDATAQFIKTARRRPIGLRHPRQRQVQVTILAALAGVLGCASVQRETEPERTVLDFAQALANADYDTAYGLMSEDYRAKIGPAEFRQQLQENDRETAQIVDTLTRPKVSIRTETQLGYRGLDEPVVLVHSDDRAFLDGKFISFYDQSSPRKALASLLQAADNQRYDVILRLLPQSAKSGLGADTLQTALSGERKESFSHLQAQLRHALDQRLPIEVSGNRATMSYGEQNRVQFVQEHGLWKIESVE